MSKTYKSLIALFAVVIIVLLLFLKKYNDIVTQEQTDLLVSKNIELINSEISYQKTYALSLAILFSKSQNIIDFLKQNDSKELKKELSKLINMISSYTKLENLEIQVHTKELKSFVRSWENKDEGISLGSFRHGLVKVRSTQKPYVSNELGKRLNIKAITPIFDKGKYIGSLEVITDYALLKKRLSLLGIDIIPLLKSKYLNIAKDHKGDKKLYDYIVIDKNYNKRLYDILSHHKEIFSFEKFYYNIGNKIVTLVPIGNLKGENPGYIAVMFKNTDQKFNYLPRTEYRDIITDNIPKSTEGDERTKIIIK